MHNTSCEAILRKKILGYGKNKIFLNTIRTGDIENCIKISKDMCKFNVRKRTYKIIYNLMNAKHVYMRSKYT